MPVLFSSSNRENKYNDIIESADFNQHLFYKLIREQRTTRSEETDTIIIDDMVLSEDECMLNGWNTHFQRLTLYNKFLGSFGEPSIFHLWNACFVLLDA
jgi:hypothetical protein